MRHYPREIEADLLFRGIDVYDWHQGQMASARLIALIEALPEDTAYWRERRDGDWSMEEYLRAATVNEMRRLRADQAAIHASKRMDVHTINSPAQQLEEEEHTDRFHEVRAHIMAQLQGNTTE